MGSIQEARWGRVCELTDQQMKRHGVPGIAVGILHEGQTATAGFGVTSVDHPLPVTDETLFQIGSITKTFTALAIVRLTEMGGVDLDAPVRAYLPEFKVADGPASACATIRHLLTHMGGWVGDFFHDTGAGDGALARYVTDMASLGQLAPVGTVWSYNNASFCVAGRVIEVVTGQSYQAALKELVLGPLSLESCTLNPGDVMTQRFAVGHHCDAEGAHVSRPWYLPRAVYPAGGISCDVRDLLRYAQFHLGDGTAEDGARLITPESMSLMHSPQVTIWGEEETMGLSWFIRDAGDVRQLSHGGGTNGQVSLLLMVPDHSFALAILTNADRGQAVTRDVSRRAIMQYLGVETPQPTALAASEQELAQYTGRYVRPFAEMELGTLGGKLIAQVTPRGGFPTEDSPSPPSPPPMSLALCDRDRLLVLDGPMQGAQGDIIRTPDGSIRWLRSGGRVHVREG
jgi:CubicO group peptidase (beta-lactamase class C family)